MTDSYRALALQFEMRAVNAVPDSRQLMLGSIDRLAANIAAAKAWVGSDLQLIVVPEYFLTAFPLGESFDSWIAKACLSADGPEYAALGKIAVENDLFLSGNGYEVDMDFDGLYFQTSFIIDPAGDVILRYRRLNSMFAPTPHDVWDRYLELHGWDGVFPVADTRIGRLACIASEEILYPEIARSLALRGAEVFCHSTAEPGGRRSKPKEIAKLARAIENMAYVVSANSGGVSGTAVPAASTDGGSKIVDPSGRVLAEAGYGPDMSAFAAIDLASLRRERRRPSMDNLLARQRLELFADTYANSIYPANTLADGPVDRSHFRSTIESTIRRRSDEGRI